MIRPLIQAQFCTVVLTFCWKGCSQTVPDRATTPSNCDFQPRNLLTYKAQYEQKVSKQRCKHIFCLYFRCTEMRSLYHVIYTSKWDFTLLLEISVVFPRLFSMQCSPGLNESWMDEWMMEIRWYHRRELGFHYIPGGDGPSGWGLERAQYYVRILIIL